MIAKLKGIIDEVAENSVILDVRGVGYNIMCSRKTIDEFPEIGSAVTLHIETIVREDFINLYGFSKAEERDWFRLLLSVQGVGMRAAIAILSVLGPGDS